MLMRPGIILILLGSTALLQAADEPAHVGRGAAAHFSGWQAMRVIRQQGQPDRLRVTRLDADENSGRNRTTLIVVNTRHSRLDFYRWLPADQRPSDADRAAQIDPRRPNDLPMAPEFAADELLLQQLPHDVLATDLADDGAMRLLVLVSDPNRVIAYRREAPDPQAAESDEPTWREVDSWDLLAGRYVGNDQLMLLRAATDGQAAPELLVSCAEGIQRLRLRPGARGSWMQPRQQDGRVDWWLADLDGDGDMDLVEWTRRGRQGLRWYENDGRDLLPPAVIDDQSIDAAVLLRRAPADADEVLTLGGAQAGVMRRLGLDRSEASPVGERRPLPLARTDAATWAGLLLDGQSALAALAADQPSLMIFALTAAGWSQPRMFPIVSDVQALVAPAAQGGTLLLWTRDAGDLHISRWQDGRFTYPRPFLADADTDEAAPAADAAPAAASGDDRRVLALESVGDTTWWVQRVGGDLHLYIWPPDQDAPQRTVFAGVAAKADKARYLGDGRLLVLDQYARNPRLVRLVDGQAQSSEPPHIRKAKLEDYRLIPHNGNPRAARLADGVLQWLDDDLQPLDQVMLPDGEALAAYAPIPGSPAAWALPRGAQYLLRLAPDDAGVMRLEASHRLPDGLEASDLRLDPHLGLLLTNPAGVIRLGPGQPTELTIRQTLDSRVGRPSGVREATVHRLLAVDVSGDGRSDVLLCDDQRHQLTLLTLRDGRLEPALSWPVFEDRAYPYGRGNDRLIPEPRAAVASDLDHDGRQDLALLCHDRLLIYLARVNEGDADDAIKDNDSHSSP